LSKAADFLVSMAQAVSNLALYPPGHPARERAIDRSYERLVRFQEEHDTARFTFLEELAVLGRRPVRPLQDWEWGRRLWHVGIQRLEITGPVAREELDRFLDEVQRRLSGLPADTAEARPASLTNLRYGTLGLRPSGDARPASGPEGVLTFSLQEEVQAVDWLHGELRDGKGLPLVEAETVVQSLALAMRGDQDHLIPLLRLKGFDQYTTTHAMNVSVLAMALGEYLELGEREIRAFGIAGLLHDLGKITVPQEILNKTGRLTDTERALMNRHPAEGARIILETEQNLDLAAVVAYEHHIKLNGEGYPSMRHPRRCHQASDLVHVCDVFDALRTHRPYREAWETERVLQYIERGAGREFDPDLALPFVRMMRAWEARVAEVEDRAEPLLVAGQGLDSDRGDDAPGA
jgi:HD-GYP domain-containing protein (c-di-GMP phosphodiesterase class II)